MRGKKAKIKCNEKLAAGGVFFIKIGKDLIGKFYEKYAKNCDVLPRGDYNGGAVRLRVRRAEYEYGNFVFALRCQDALDKP